MPEKASSFLAKSTVKANDRDHRRKINFNISKYNSVVPDGKKQFINLPLARERAKNIKWRSLESLDKLLEEFETKITKRGAKVIWAETAEDAQNSILKICREKNCTSLVKSKSMATEEISLNDFLHHNGVESIETDLGEYIQQLHGEPPYHIVTPAMHKSKEDVAKLFSEKLGTPANLSPEEITQVARNILRERYRTASIGITGGNFIVADVGGIALTENEGNGRLSAGWPATHIVVVGIEKLIPSLKDLALFWPLLSTYGTGQKVTSYNSVIFGPRQTGEVDGPQEMYVILLDNGRTKLLANPSSREALYCIRCGACLNACPVYKNIGGHAYSTAYSGPIGSVITPHLKQMKEWKHLSYASSLCGNCTEVCPVKINLHELLLDNRHESVESVGNGLVEKTLWAVWKRAMLNRSLMNSTSGRLKTWGVKHMMKNWSIHREELFFPSRSFNELWKERNRKT